MVTIIGGDGALTDKTESGAHLFEILCRLRLCLATTSFRLQQEKKKSTMRK